ncbi:MAG: hypothetical protein RLZZ536_2927, partial [Planctomycetota bacterium]
ALTNLSVRLEQNGRTVDASLI